MGECAFAKLPKADRPTKIRQSVGKKLRTKSAVVPKDQQTQLVTRMGSKTTIDSHEGNSKIFQNNKGISTLEQENVDDILCASASISKIYRNSNHSIMKSKDKKNQNYFQTEPFTDDGKSQSIDPQDPQDEGKLTKIRSEDNLIGYLGVIPQKMQGVIQQQNQYSKVMIFDSSVSMEFTIPKASAGPLLVPFFDYHNYVNAL